jgi:hypothetical protein
MIPVLTVSVSDQDPAGCKIALRAKSQIKTKIDTDRRICPYLIIV